MDHSLLLSDICHDASLQVYTEARGDQYSVPWLRPHRDQHHGGQAGRLAVL